YSPRYVAPYPASNFVSIWFHHGSESASTPSRSKITADSITEVETLRSWHVDPKSEGRKRRTLNSEFSSWNTRADSGFVLPLTFILSSVEEERKTRVALYKFCSSWVRSRRKLVSELL